MATQQARIFWSDRYRASAQRCMALADVETDDMTREALRDAAARFTLAMLDHMKIERRNLLAEAGIVAVEG
jgi:hypothetical protein